MKKRGFTLIELVVVIVILGILSAVALPKFVNIGADARVAVMQSALGSMRAANAMIYAKAATAGVQGAAPPQNVTVNGVTVSTTYGFATNVTELARVMDLQPTTDFTVTAGALQHARAQTGATCQIAYTVAGGANTPPVYTTTLSSDGCS